MTNELNRTWVITSAISDVPLNHKLLATLKNYCEHNKAKLIISPIKYDQNGTHEYSWPEEIHQYFVTDNIDITTGLRLLADVRISPAIGNPISGYEAFCKGDSIILPHPQLAMKTVAMSHVDPATIIHTTGAITAPVYTHTKQGSKAEFNHSYSALVVEEDSEINGFHIRVLNSSSEGDFYDLDTYYSGKKVKKDCLIDAIVLGDEHIIHADPSVTAAILTNPDSLINVLKPKYIIRHDSLDFYSANHHHKGNPFTSYAKHISGTNDAAKELKLTMDYVVETTPEYCQSIIVSSNHNEALTRWLMECKPELEPWNALLYHELMYLVLKETRMGKSGAEYPNPFALWAKHNYDLTNVVFLPGYASFKLHDIELAFHGDKGANGSRGSAGQFSKLGTKSIVGHAHSSGIYQGCYQVGTSSYLRLEYNSGPSSWIHSDCLIHQNGKRQMIFIIKGKYRR